MTFDRELVGCIEHLPHLVSFQSTLGGSVGLCTKNTLYRFICCFPYNINNFPSSERITPFPSDQLRIHLTNSGNNIDLNDFNNHQSTNEQICTFVVSFLTPRPPPLLLVTSFLAPRDDVGFLVTLLETGRATGAGARGGAGAETRTAAGCWTFCSTKKKSPAFVVECPFAGEADWARLTAAAPLDTSLARSCR